MFFMRNVAQSLKSTASRVLPKNSSTTSLVAAPAVGALVVAGCYYKTNDMLAHRDWMVSNSEQLLKLSSSSEKTLMEPQLEDAKNNSEDSSDPSSNTPKKDQRNDTASAKEGEAESNTKVDEVIEKIDALKVLDGKQNNGESDQATEDSGAAQEETEGGDDKDDDQEENGDDANDDDDDDDEEEELDEDEIPPKPLYEPVLGTDLDKTDLWDNFNVKAVRMTDDEFEDEMYDEEEDDIEADVVLPAPSL